MDADVIVVGTRVGGAATAMLLARAGLRVLAVDRTRFPSDTLSTHQVQLPGGALLRRWGLLDTLIAQGTPAARMVTFDAGPAVLRGAYPHVGGVDAVYSPRRTRLDTLLVDAARTAGATVEEGFVVEGLTGAGGRVTGIRGTPKGGTPRTFTAPLVIGADGKHSTVARAAGAREYRSRRTTSAGCYTYFAGLPVTGGEIYSRPGMMVTLWPTDDGLTIVFLAVPLARFAGLRTDLTGNYLAAVASVGDLGERLATAHRAGPVRATADLPNVFRRPYGPGWALVGDAGLVMDPITGQGIGHALRDAESLSAAIVAGLGGRRPLDAALAAHHRDRDTARRPMYDLTTRLARFRPDRAGPTLFPAIAADPALVTRFLGVLTGAEPADAFFAPAVLRRIVGTRGLLRMVAGRPAPATSG
ncbi:FAD-dependent oxidoreductase [Actinoplanes ianthinogenes]|uniref:FAD-dependent oxidoreductase n=1 Tax=Actinoplanes ianthinogenes TaxID=122358 RepID=A0ABM7M9G5_9ACTN|nr:NAD(P)/FAD-dependent oxidoreductase [Actinoplanes ianthinogenes]BCJ48285.1 FAD-dependent oxidoreductase [Actinoplanes ianthinogenes]GGR07697.1 FAD-dependent oxidoreductase [Actinoplanes ianthinogenes]